MKQINLETILLLTILYVFWAIFFSMFLSKVFGLLALGLKESTTRWQNFLYGGTNLIGVPYLLPLILALLLSLIHLIYPIFPYFQKIDDYGGFIRNWRWLTSVLTGIVVVIAIIELLWGHTGSRENNRNNVTKVVWRTLIIPLIMFIPSVINFVSNAITEVSKK